MVVEMIGWLALALNLWGNLALTSMSRSGWLIRLGSNAAWIVYSPGVGAWPLFANHLTFAVVNVVGWVRWSKKENKL